MWGGSSAIVELFLWTNFSAVRSRGSGLSGYSWRVEPIGGLRAGGQAPRLSRRMRPDMAAWIEFFKTPYWRGRGRNDALPRGHQGDRRQGAGGVTVTAAGIRRYAGRVARLATHRAQPVRPPAHGNPVLGRRVRHSPAATPGPALWRWRQPRRRRASRR